MSTTSAQVRDVLAQDPAYWPACPSWRDAVRYGPAVAGASEGEGARTGDRVAFMLGQQIQGAAAVRVALRYAGAIDPAGAGAARPDEDAGAVGELRLLGDGHGQAARVRVEADDLEVLHKAEQVQGALPEDQVVAVHAVRVTGLRRQLDDLAGA